MDGSPERGLGYSSGNDTDVGANEGVVLEPIVEEDSGLESSTSSEVMIGHSKGERGGYVGKSLDQV